MNPLDSDQIVGQVKNQVNPQQQELLRQLKDVALPVNPGWWPPAPGWWIVLLALLLIAAILYWSYRKYLAHKSSSAWRSLALDEHRRLRQLITSSEDQSSVIAQLSVLMRRVALAVEPRSRIASLTDDQWLLKLDTIGQTNGYTNGVGSVLYRHPYQRALHLDDKAVNGLFNLTADTIKNASPRTDQLMMHQSEGNSVAAL